MTKQDNLIIKWFEQKIHLLSEDCLHILFKFIAERLRIVENSKYECIPRHLRMTDDDVAISIAMARSKHVVRYTEANTVV